jgi:hypothetical protein
MINKETEKLQNFLVQTGNYDEKREKKQKLVRNEFEKTGKFGIPLVKRQDIDLNKIEPWSYVKTKLDDEENRHKTIHFFTYDWNFEAAYAKPEATLEKLDQYYVLLTPEFSTYKDMPLVLQAYSTFKNRWCGAFWQRHGMKVIPTIAWGTPASYEFCFDGVEQGGIVAVSTYAREDNEKGFMHGYNKMLDAIKPSAIVCYGDPFPNMRGNIKAISPFNKEELIAKLGITEYTRKLLAGELYPSN